jgi:hypothetical protein
LFSGYILCQQSKDPALGSRDGHGTEAFDHAQGRENDESLAQLLNDRLREKHPTRGL